MRIIKPFCDMCNDTCIHPDDPSGQADCGYCGGSFAWRQRAAYFARMKGPKKIKSHTKKRQFIE